MLDCELVLGYIIDNLSGFYLVGDYWFIWCLLCNGVFQGLCIMQIWVELGLLIEVVCLDVMV